MKPRPSPSILMWQGVCLLVMLDFDFSMWRGGIHLLVALAAAPTPTGTTTEPRPTTMTTRTFPVNPSPFQRGQEGSIPQRQEGRRTWYTCILFYSYSTLILLTTDDAALWALFDTTAGGCLPPSSANAPTRRALPLIHFPMRRETRHPLQMSFRARCLARLTLTTREGQAYKVRSYFLIIIIISTNYGYSRWRWPHLGFPQASSTKRHPSRVFLRVRCHYNPSSMKTYPSRCFCMLDAVLHPSSTQRDPHSPSFSTTSLRTPPASRSSPSQRQDEVGSFPNVCKMVLTARINGDNGNAGVHGMPANFSFLFFHTNYIPQTLHHPCILSNSAHHGYGGLGWGWVFHRDDDGLSSLMCGAGLCPVNMGTLVLGVLEYDGVCEGQWCPQCCSSAWTWWWGRGSS